VDFNLFIARTEEWNDGIMSGEEKRNWNIGILE
jgi:hypothetical protein